MKYLFFHSNIFKEKKKLEKINRYYNIINIIIIIINSILSNTDHDILFFYNT